MTSRLTVDGYTFDNPPSDYRKIIQLSNSPQTVFNRFTADFYQSDSQDVQLQVQGELSLNESTDLTELQTLQDKAISGGEVTIDFDPFFSGTGVITDTPFRQEEQRGEYDFTFKVNEVTTDPSGYPQHATPTTGNTFELGGYDFGFDPDSVQQEYERQTASVDTLQGLNRTVDNKGLIPRVTVSGRTDGRGGHLLWQKARNNALSYLTAEFQNGWSLITRLQVGNDPDAPDFVTGLLQYSVDFLIVKDPSGGIGQVSSFIDHDVRDSGTYTADSDAGDSTTDAVNFTVQSGDTTLNGQTTTFPKTTVDVQVGGATNYVYVYDEDQDGNGTVQVNQSAFPSDAAPLYEVETDDSGITNVIDRRESDTSGGSDSVDSIDYTVDGGTGSIDGSYVQWDTTTVQLDTNNTNYVFVEDDDGDGNGTVTVNQSAVPSDSLGLWKVETDSNSVTSETDLRDSLVDDGDGSGSDLTFSTQFGIDDTDFDFARVMALGTEQIADPVESGFPPALGLVSLSEAVPDPSDTDLQWLGKHTESITFTVDDGGSATGAGGGTTETTDWGTASDWDAYSSIQNVAHDSWGDLPGAGTLTALWPGFDQNGSALIGYWPQHDSSGPLDDVSGAGNDLTENGAPNYDKSGPLNTTVIGYDGSNDYFALGNHLWDGTGDFTAIIWIKFGGSVSDYGNFMAERGSGSAEYMVRWAYQQVSDYDRINFEFVNGSGSRTDLFSNNGGYSDGVWHMCAIGRINGDTMFLDIDGGADRSTTAYNTGDFSTTGRKFTIASREGGGEHFEGDMWLGQVYDRGLTATELSNLYDVLTGGTLTTATKSFSGETKPDLTNLSYSLNGETITLTVIGSPGTQQEEQVTQTLDGGTSYSLTWNNSHKNFRIKVDLSTATQSTSPTFSSATLEGTVGSSDADQNVNTTWRIRGAQHEASGHEYEGGGVESQYGAD